MEAEERAAQSAKLQELIRRGTPRDLQEANKLMKVMAGYDQRNKTDYRAKAAEEVSRVQQKARILEEMLQNFKPSDTIQEGDVFEVLPPLLRHNLTEIDADILQELVNALASAHPKIQKMCEEESDDQEAVAKLLEINDSIHRTIERYRLVKKGDLDAATRIPKGTLGISGVGVKTGPDNELSLIDFGDDSPDAPNGNGQIPQATASNSSARPALLEDDLLGLSVNDGGNGSTFPQGGGITLGMGMPVASRSTPQPNTLPQPQVVPQTNVPNYDPFAAFTSPPPPTNNGSSGLGSLASTAQTKPTPQTKVDPFAAFNNPPSNPAARATSPFQFQSAAELTTAQPQSVPLASLTAKPAQPASPAAAASTDDEWTFTSALPPQPAPVHRLTVSDSTVRIIFDVARPATTASSISFESKISNNTADQITDLTFQLAVTKVSSFFLFFPSSSS